MKNNMLLQSKDNAKAPNTIGKIGPARCGCILRLNIKTHQATTVYNENGKLVCFFAKQTRNTCSQVENQYYYYVFFPLYFGESPIACIAPQEIKAGRNVIPLYTFKRKYDEQPQALRHGYFGERMYTHGFLTQNNTTKELEYYRFPQQASEELNLAVPYLVGKNKETNIPSLCLETSYLCPSLDLCCRNIEFHKPGIPGRHTILMDCISKSMRIAEGSDIIEAVCLWCAYNIHLGRKITCD